MGFIERATIVVVPRERFGMAQRSFRSLLMHTPASVPIVYVDGGSPPPLRAWLQERSRQRGFRLIRTEHSLSPNEARNLGLSEVDTPYVVFFDNDVLVSPEWLAALVRCADETGAWLTSPVYCIGEPAFQYVHVAGGELTLSVRPGGSALRDHHGDSDRPLAEVLPRARRSQVTYAEFHVLLARREVFDRIGPLDEGFLSAPEHIDLCLLVQQAGGSIWFEPASIINYVPARRLTRVDAPYYLLRWSDRWNRASLEHLRAKWNLAPDDDFCAGQEMWLTDKRLRVFNPAWSLARRMLGWRGSIGAGRLLEQTFTRLLIPDEDERRAAHLAYCRARTVPVARARASLVFSKVNGTSGATNAQPVLGGAPSVAPPAPAKR
jgi:GT2 family glycosyltransferase